ncbi:MAG: PstS family phosphate ABC transporter substrate-binding protein [Nitrospira sp.]|nr:PstS family phosphate ABC transporter substrate-binding protein [Candidatus Manganitrophaceae bacterium]HIL34284.1 PstS family phosphate ABC transporter substrate-binding protein [Candidatus Manganitrophaceae bacterium]
MKHILKHLLVAFILFILLPNQGWAKRALVKIDGSSTVFPITEAVAEDFQVQNRKIRVTIGVSGTGGGFKKFCSGEVDIANASRPIKPSEVKLCAGNKVEYIELPVAYDGIAIVVNPKNPWVDFLTVNELKKIWEPKAKHKVTRWNHVRPHWPEKEIHLYGPGIDSGTFDYFTEAIVGESGASRGDFTASEDDNVLVQGISTDLNALGFFGVAYYEYNKERLKLVPIDDGKDENGKGPILPTYNNILEGNYQPLARPIFIYVRSKSADRPEIQKFIEFYMTQGADLSKEVGYIALPNRAYELAHKRFKERMTGSIFGGKGAQIGVKVEDLLEKEGK